MEHPLLSTSCSLQGAAVDSRRRTASEFQRYATLSAATHRLLEADLSEQRRQEVGFRPASVSATLSV